MCAILPTRCFLPVLLEPPRTSYLVLQVDYVLYIPLLAIWMSFLTSGTRSGELRQKTKWMR
ncbi:hypothetical protein BDW62DRAFT_190289 [Aspergillus aurantiobrunneus]